ALVRPIQVREKLAQRIRVLDHRRLDRVEAVALVDLADRLQHAARRGDLGRAAVGEAARQARPEFVRLGRKGFPSCRLCLSVLKLYSSSQHVKKSGGTVVPGR